MIQLIETNSRRTNSVTAGANAPIAGQFVVRAEQRVFTVHSGRPRMRTVAAGKGTSTTITDLDDNQLRLLRPIAVAFERQDGEVVAIFREAGIAMSAENEQEAVRALKDQIVDAYNLYRREPRLGPEPTRRLKVLEGYLGRQGRQQNREG